MKTELQESPLLRRLALAALFGLLLVLALRTTMTEVLRENISQKTARLAAAAKGKEDDFHRLIGPGVTAGLAVATAALTALAAGCAARAGALTRARLVQFAMIAVVIALAMASAFRAANHFSALIGAVDLAMALLAGWCVCVLCQQKLLGDSGRRIIIATLIAILAAWCFKGLYTRFVEMPDNIAEYYKHKAEFLTQMGIRPDDEYQIKLFESRMLGQEISGFISYSNVMAEGLIGLCAVLAGLLAARLIPAARLALPAIEAPRNSNKTRTPKRKIDEAASQEISLTKLLLIAGGVVLAAGLLTGILTRSRGGSVIAIVCAAVIAAGACRWQTIWTRRKILLWTFAAVALLCVVAVVGYGVTRDSLPSKSLTFRWHYWTGAAKIIEQSPALGVGLNNFGDYYASVKRASAPEDVTDPHSFFIRIASEIGIPAAVLLGALILWQIIRAVRPLPAEQPRPSLQGLPLFVATFVLCTVWWVCHLFIGEDANVYILLLTPIFIMISVGASWMAAELAANLSPTGIRVVAVSGLIGAIGMLAYDQINMGLLVGPVAMLFWILLNVADSYSPSTADIARPRLPELVAWLPTVGCGAAAVVLGVAVWIPLLRDAMPWDPAPYEIRFIKAIQSPSGSPAALVELDAAIARAPRSVELRNQRILLKQEMHLPTVEDVAAILQFDHANASVRVSLAMRDLEIPPVFRAVLLEQALYLDAQFPADEIKRIQPAEKARIVAAIVALTTRSY